MENRHADRSHVDRRHPRILDAGAAVRFDPERRAGRRRSAMTELLQKFGAKIVTIDTSSAHEVYIDIYDSDVRDIVAYLRSEYDARIVAVFAEDRRAQQGAFFNHYVFE